MIVLGIDGALGSFSAAVVRDGEHRASVQLEGNVALEAGLDAVARALRDEGVPAGGVDRIAVGIGPGGFTGLRIAISYAKSLAFAWRVPLVGVSSFDLLEYRLNLPRALAVVGGRAGIISARYRDGETFVRGSGLIADVLDAVLPARNDEPLPVVGAPQDARSALGERACSVTYYEPLVTPPAAAAALVGGERTADASPHAVRADYGEAPAAKVPKFS
jgi:tRNA threonylcarbamoyladenosine biosynthesis protein TsaB